MAANKRKQDEKHLKMLREMVALPHNKQCFDCQQRGPTYVNMTIGSFVCTSCSGILRGLNPPSRVKSISMTSFSPEEMEFLKSRGNDYCRKVWLGLFDSRTQTEPESKDEQKVKDFMIQKYEKKRWYVAPDQAFHDQPPTPNSVPSDSLAHATVKPLSSHNQNQHPQSLNRPRVGSGAVTTPPQSQAPPQHPAQPAPLQDIFGDLAGDPFASQQATKAPQQANFADFGNFNTLNNASAPQVQASQSGGFLPQPAQSQGLDMFAPSSHSSLPSSIPSTTTPAQITSSAGDKYAALAELDDVFGGSSSTTSLPTSGISSASGTGIAPSTWNGTTLSTSNSWSGTDSTGSMVWGNVGAATVAVPASSNPFSMTTNTAVNKVNPFMGFGSPPGQQQPAFSQPVQGFGQLQQQQQQRFQMQQQAGMPASVNQQQFGQFPLQQAQPNMFMQSPPGQVGQFGGMQNGVGLGPQVPPPAQTWGAGAAMVGGWGGFAQQQQGVAQPGGGQFNAFSGTAPGFGGIPVAQPQQFANWGQQPAANPFMGAPGGNKSNPFL